MRKRLQRSKADKPTEPYKPRKTRDFGNRFCIKCGNFRPLGFGRKCPWCYVQDGDSKDQTQEEKLSEETKKVLKERRERRKQEAKREKTILDKVKKLLSLDRQGGVSRKYYSARGRRTLRAKQAKFLADQLDMLLSVFEPDFYGGYTVYEDALERVTPEIRALKKEIVRIRRTFISVKVEPSDAKKNTNRQNRRSGTPADLFSPFTRPGYPTRIEDPQEPGGFVPQD